MNDATNTFIENPTLVGALVVAIIGLVSVLIYLGKYVLNKLSDTVGNNTTAMNNVSSAVKSMEDSNKSVHTKIDGIVVQQQIDEAIKKVQKQSK